MGRKMFLLYSALLSLAVGVLIYQLILTQDNSTEYNGRGVPVVLWWTQFGTNGTVRNCQTNRCYFTHDRTFLSHQDLKAILFYGSSFRVEDLPRWKLKKRVKWGLLHEESPRNNPILVHQEALSLFDYSSTFSRNSDVPLTLVDLPGKEDLLDAKYFVRTEAKTALMEEKGVAPLLYIQSDCLTASNRDSYVAELMKHIKVDSYGACLNNKQLDPKFKENYLDSLNSEEFLSFVAGYKFVLAMENALCEDYITEKLWRPLLVGSVPVYLGSPSFTDWLPNNKSAISILDFASPKELAAYLKFLCENDEEYNAFLAHKLTKNYEIPNKRLLGALRDRGKANRDEFGFYVEDFECHVCDNFAKDTEPLSTMHYDCPLPIDPITREPNEQDFWYVQWIQEKCGAKLLSKYVKSNDSIDAQAFENEKQEMWLRHRCL